MLRERYSDKDACYDVLCEVWTRISYGKIDDTTLDQIGKMLGIVYAHCPLEVESMVICTIREVVIRRNLNLVYGSA